MAINEKNNRQTKASSIKLVLAIKSVKQDIKFRKGLWNNHGKVGANMKYVLTIHSA